MMHNECRCFHHTVAMLLSVVGFVGAVLFFWTAISAKSVFGMDDLFYFESVVVLALAGHGTKACKCCRGHGQGYQCKDCVVPSQGMKMDM